jgi:transcriptional regulator with XRE-family HTH domain
MEATNNSAISEERLRIELGRRLVARREQRGWTRAELARHVGVSMNRLGKWEIGHHAPGLMHLFVLALHLEISLDELITGRPWSGASGELDRGRLESAAGLARRLSGLLDSLSSFHPAVPVPQGGDDQENRDE